MPHLNPSPTPNEILLTPVDSKKFPEKTVGAYLAARMQEIWLNIPVQGRLPSGFGVWESEVIKALVNAGHLEGTMDDEGYLDTFNESDYGKLMEEAFSLLRNADYSTLALPPEPKEYYIVKLLFGFGATEQDDELVGYRTDSYTKEDAELTVNTLNTGLKYSRWVAVHIPR